jgi:hypothetical protein
VEVKSNADDIGGAFCSYQKALLWLCGAEGFYDPADFITKAYLNGHFSSFTLRHGDDLLVMSPQSFASCLPEACCLADASRDEVEVNTDAFFFINKIFFVTKENNLEGLSSRVSAWVLYILSTDKCLSDELGEADEDSVERIRQRVGEKYSTQRNWLCTAELLTLYESEGLMDQVFVIGHEEQPKT